MTYLQSSIREATSMNRKQLIRALIDYRASIGKPYLYGPPSWRSKDELVALWLEVYGVKELAR